MIHCAITAVSDEDIYLGKILSKGMKDETLAFAGTSRAFVSARPAATITVSCSVARPDRVG